MSGPYHGLSVYRPKEWDRLTTTHPLLISNKETEGSNLSIGVAITFADAGLRDRGGFDMVEIDNKRELFFVSSSLSFLVI
jgi:hypothetical protein